MLCFLFKWTFIFFKEPVVTTRGRHCCAGWALWPPARCAGLDRRCSPCSQSPGPGTPPRSLRISIANQRYSALANRRSSGCAGQSLWPAACRANPSRCLSGASAPREAPHTLCNSIQLYFTKRFRGLRKACTTRRWPGPTVTLDTRVLHVATIGFFAFYQFNPQSSRNSPGLRTGAAPLTRQRLTAPARGPEADH
jgi:hypothetical protein